MQEFVFSEVGIVDNIELTCEGEIAQNSEKAVGIRNVVQNVGNESFVMASYAAVLGSRSLYPLQNGEYDTDNLRDRTNSSMVRD